MPNGPYILWPENAKKSQSICATFVGRWATPCAPSTTTRAPAAWAAAQISATSFTAPSTLETHVTATHLVRRAANPLRKAATSNRPSGSSGITLSAAFIARATCCHGTQLLWCSAAETQISSPGPISQRAIPAATKLSAAVVPAVNTTSSADRAPMNCATASRARS